MKKKVKLKNTTLNILIGIIIFLIPSNFFIKFFESESYVNGLRIDYLIPKLFISDIFILIVLIIYIFSLIKNFFKIKKSFLKSLKPSAINLKKIITKNKILLSLLAILIIKQFWTSHPISSVSYLLKILELGIFTSFILNNKEKISYSIIEKSVLLTLVFQSILAIYQYLYQKTFIGYLFLGEPNLNNYIGVSKSTLFGVEKILPYGTTAHPNVLGGVLAFYVLFLLNRMRGKIFKIKNALTFIIILISTIALFLTQSFSAILTLLIGSTIILISNRKPTLKNIVIIIFGLLFFTIFFLGFLSKIYPENQSIVRRNYLNMAAIKMANNNFLDGVGLNNFTSSVEKYSSNREVVRFVQPVHNIFLLFLAETGVVGLSIIVIFTRKIFLKKRPTIIYRLNVFQEKRNNWWWILVLLPIALLDHYFLTLNTGLLLIIFSLTFL